MQTRRKRTAVRQACRFRTIITPPRMRRGLLLGASGIALAFALNANAALADDECGVVGAGGTATCTPTGNSFPDGIRYQVVDLTIVVQDGVIIDTTTKAGEFGGLVSGGSGNFGGLAIEAGTYGGVGVVITTDEVDGDAIFAMSKDGSVAVESVGKLTTTGASAHGINAISGDDTVGIFSVGDITTSGNFAEGIAGEGDAGVTIFSIGNVGTAGNEANGIVADSASGAVKIFSSGDIDTAGDQASGIAGDAATTVAIYSTGDISTKGDEGVGIHGISATSTVGVVSSGDISTLGKDAIGIYAEAADKIGITSKGDIGTVGEGATAIAAISTAGNIIISSTGDLSTQGQFADGIFGKSTGAAVFIVSTGHITTQDYDADAISVIASTTSKIYSFGDLSTAGKVASGISASVTAGQIMVTSEGDIATKGTSSFGIGVFGISGATVTSDGSISTTGFASGAIAASALSGTVTITASGEISTVGDNSSGINAGVLTGTVIIDWDGDVATKGIQSAGISGSSDNGPVTVTSAGDIATLGQDSIAISATNKGSAAPIQVTSVGDLSTQGQDAHAIESWTLGQDSTITIVSTGDLDTAGDSAFGITAHTQDSGAGISITAIGDVSTSGGGARGIQAQSVGAGADITLKATGDIETAGTGAHGIAALTGDSDIAVVQAGSVTTMGTNALGILASSGASGDVLVTASGVIVTQGNDAAGISGYSSSGNVALNVVDVAAHGKGSYAVLAQAAGGAIAVKVSGDVLGGWSSGAGVSISAGADSTLQVTGGSIGAWTDYAIFNGSSKLTITNSGTITGEVFLGGGDDVFNNISVNSFNLRQFADSDGDGIRDTESVAEADFGAGNDNFDNIGTLRLANVSGATAWDTTGQIAHPGGGNADITQNGVEQGFLTNLETFNHAGLISLADGTAGDLLVITDQADGATKGANVFTSNGGALALDVVLDDGSSKQSDVLILDKAALGTGATRIVVGNAGGSGGQTTGDGILVVNVRDTSDPDEFVLGGTPVAGAYQYDLVFQNAAKTDQNWYLQSSFFEGALEYPAIQSGALSTWYADLGNLHERLSERRRDVAEGQSAALPTVTDLADASAVRTGGQGQGGWLRVIGGELDIDQAGPADFELNTTRAEAGFDVGVNDLLDQDDWLVFGGFAGYGWSSVGFSSGADIDFDVATVGAYATYFRGPYYFDALVKLDWLDGDYNSKVVSQDGDVEIPVFGISLESGYRLDLSSGGLYLQPQAQLSYAHAGDDSFTDDAGARIDLEDADSLRGRIGARLGQDLSSETGAARGNFYVEGSVNQEFLGETEAKVSGLTLEQDLPETTFEIGGGFDIALPQDGVSFTVDADYTFGEEADGISATGGLRINW